jgi:hypothetical protein
MAPRWSVTVTRREWSPACCLADVQVTTPPLVITIPLAVESVSSVKPFQVNRLPVRYDILHFSARVVATVPRVIS